ncbi:MAG: hypothetical protein WD894_10300 [Pirellulales bacterium]
MRYSNKTRRRFAFEYLETRAMMAGNVTAAVNSGTLELNGDNLSNAFSVAGTANPFEVVITPLNDAATNQPTTINGNSTPITISGVTAGLTAQLFDGHDEFTLTNFDVQTLFSISAHGGNDRIRIGEDVPYGQPGGTVGAGSLAINGGAGDDNVFFGRTFVDNAISFVGDVGADTLRIYNASGSSLYGVFGNENDTANIAYLTTTSFITLEMQAGNDLISDITTTAYGAVSFFAGEGFNTVAMDAVHFYANLLCYTGYSADTFQLKNSILETDTDFQLLGGDDNALVQGNTIKGDLLLQGQGENDFFQVLGNRFEIDVTIIMGVGNDTLYFRYNSVNEPPAPQGNNYTSDGFLIFYVYGSGNEGYDYLFASGNVYRTSQIHPLATLFESVAP